MLEATRVHFGTGMVTKLWFASTGLEASAKRVINASFYTCMTCQRCQNVSSILNLTLAPTRSVPFFILIRKPRKKNAPGMRGASAGMGPIVDTSTPSECYV